jgi:hypothetical protein
MCELALVGAETESFRLLGIWVDSQQDLDVELVQQRELLDAFPATDSVVRVTVGGCSCALLRGLGSSGAPAREAHVVGPAYAFRKGIAAASAVFGGVRLRIVKGAVVADVAPRVMSLGDFLRFGLNDEDSFVAIMPRVVNAR